jgi:hypothetical protein
MMIFGMMPTRTVQSVNVLVTRDNKRSQDAINSLGNEIFSISNFFRPTKDQSRVTGMENLDIRNTSAIVNWWPLIRFRFPFPMQSSESKEEAKQGPRHLTVQR